MGRYFITRYLLSVIEFIQLSDESKNWSETVNSIMKRTGVATTVTVI